MTSIIHSVGLLLSMFLLGPWMAEIPLSALAGVLMVTAWRMNEWPAIKVIFSKRIKTSMAQYLATMVATVVFDLTVAILIGVGLSMVLFVIKTKSDLKIEKEDCGVRGGRKTVVVYLSGPLFFGTQETLSHEVNMLKYQGYERIIFSFRGVTSIDHSEAEEIEEILNECEKEGVDAMVCGLDGIAAKMFDRLDMEFGCIEMFPSAVQALESLE